MLKFFQTIKDAISCDMFIIIEIIISKMAGYASLF